MNDLTKLLKASDNLPLCEVCDLALDAGLIKRNSELSKAIVLLDKKTQTFSDVVLAFGKRAANQCVFRVGQSDLVH